MTTNRIMALHRMEVDLETHPWQEDETYDAFSVRVLAELGPPGAIVDSLPPPRDWAVEAGKVTISFWLPVIPPGSEACEPVNERRESDGVPLVPDSRELKARCFTAIGAMEAAADADDDKAYEAAKANVIQLRAKLEEAREEVKTRREGLAPLPKWEPPEVVQVTTREDGVVVVTAHALKKGMCRWPPCRTTTHCDHECGGRPRWFRLVSPPRWHERLRGITFKQKVRRAVEDLQWAIVDGEYRESERRHAQAVAERVAREAMSDE